MANYKYTAFMYLLINLSLLGAIIKSAARLVAVSNIINETAKFLQKRTKISVFLRFDACILKNKRGNVVETIYSNLKMFGGKMNELYKFEGVTKPTFY